MAPGPTSQETGPGSTPATAGATTMPSCCSAAPSAAAAAAAAPAGPCHLEAVRAAESARGESRVIYLDYNATTPVDPLVVEAMLPFFSTHYGNPSSAHPYGQAAKAAIAVARSQVAQLVQCYAQDVVFTSCSTESINLAILGSLSHRTDEVHVITSAIEHVAVLNALEKLEARGKLSVSRLPVDRNGVVAVADLEAAMRPSTLLISIMLANNEVGTLQPIRALAAAAHAKNPDVVFHCDASQALGKLDVTLGTGGRLEGVDLVSLAGHKLYAPKGVGALVVANPRATPLPLTFGAPQERGLSPGTENTPYIVAFGAACALAKENLAAYEAAMRARRDQLWALLAARLGAPGAIRVNGHPTERLPNTLSVCIKGVDSAKLIADVAGQLAISGGSACHEGSARVHVSHVLTAMGMAAPEELVWAQGVLRLSVGRTTSPEEIERAAEIICAAAEAQLSQQKQQPEASA